jgi:transposase
MNSTHESKAVESAISIRRIFVAIELSKSTWVVAIQPPTVDKVSLFRIPGGDIEKLFVLLDQARQRGGEADEICACYEAGYDGFWIHRALIARGVVSTVFWTLSAFK